MSAGRVQVASNGSAATGLAVYWPARGKAAQFLIERRWVAPCQGFRIRSLQRNALVPGGALGHQGLDDSERRIIAFCQARHRQVGVRLRR